MKNLKIVCLILVLTSLTSLAAPTIKMLTDSTPAYSMQILENGFAGYSTGAVLSTFCVESPEHFAPGGIYYAVLSDKTANDGSGGRTPDPLDPRSAFLGTKFLSGDADFQDQEALQKAIWYIEEEPSGVNNSYVTAAINAVNNNEWSGLGNMRIANLYESYSNGIYSGFVQDQLLMISPVPVPGAIVLGGLGTMIVGLIRRRIMPN
jgi:hypothetical protein